MKLTYEKNGGLSDSEPDSERGTGGNADEVRYDAEELLTGTPERIYQGMILAGELKAHCLEIQEQAEQRMEARANRWRKQRE